MSEDLTEEELEEKYSDEPEYTLSLNDKVYALNDDLRESIERRAELAYEGNHMFSCWWRTADSDDEQDADSIHQEGDPILVIETEGPIVPWERLDQLEMEMKDTSSFHEFDAGGSDVDEGNGMKTVKPGEVQGNEQEKSRTHFGITPQEFEEVPSPDGERPDRIPAKPLEFDEPTMVMWVPEDPDIEHTWSTGEAIAPMYNWVEWNVQQKANQPKRDSDKKNCHDRWQSLVEMKGCEVTAKLSPAQDPPSKEKQSESGSVKRKGKDQFENGKFGGDNWNV